MLKKITNPSRKPTHLTGLDEVKLAQILEAIPNEVYIFDRETLNIEYANPRATENLGYSLEELRKMTVLDVKKELTTEDLHKLVAPLIMGEITQIKLETKHYRADGSSYPVEVYLQLVQEEKQCRFFVIVVDISERKTAETYLQEKAEQLEGIANNIPGIIYRLRYQDDGSTQVEYVSDRVEEILEISKAEIYADFNKFLEAVHPEDKESVKEAMREVRIHLTPLFWEGRMITASGRLIWVQARSKCQKQGDGSTVRNGVLLDITQQKEAELALQKSEETFRQFAENIDDVLWMIDPQCRELFYVSPAYEKIWGYPQEYIQKNPQNFLKPIHPEDKVIVEKMMAQPIIKKHNLEYRIIRPDGEVRWLHDRSFPIKNEQGEIFKVAGIAQDITNKKQKESESFRDQELSAAIFDEATDALYLIEPKTLQVLDCNRRAVELAEATEKEVIIDREANCLYNKPFSEVEKVMEEKGVWNEEIIITSLEGNQFWGDVAWKKITVAGETMYLVRISNISDRKAFEAELKTTNQCLELTNQELARATRLKDEFLANMSHELRTPLNAILGMSEGLKEGCFQAISEQQKQAVKTIDTSAKHLLALINDILDLAKVQAGQVELNLTHVSIKELCESSLMFIRQPAHRKKIQLKTEINTIFSTINADELRLRQILINLLSNAVKFTPDGGEVTLKVKDDLDHYSIIFSVIDTGIGIEKEDFDRLFSPFVQLDSQLNRNYAGTGLGLSLVRRLSELHGGSVSVESEKGEGSAFHVKLPLPEGELMTHGNLGSFYSQKVTDFSVSPSVLLINSHRPAVDTTCSYLEASNYQVYTITEIDQLFPTFEELTPTIIVIDLQSFGETGKEMIQQIRQIPSLESTPLIALTGVDVEEEILGLGANICLFKPIRLRNLINMIQRLLPEEFLQ